MRELISAAEHMGKFVVQAHSGAAQCPAGEPRTAQRSGSSLDVVQPGDCIGQPMRQYADGFLRDL
jgi:hypothetical protein